MDNLTSDGIKTFTWQQDNKAYFLTESNVKRSVFVICEVSGRRLCWLESRLPGFEDRFTAGKAATKSVEHSNIRMTTRHDNDVLMVFMKKQLKPELKDEARCKIPVAVQGARSGALA